MLLLLGECKGKNSELVVWLAFLCPFTQVRLTMIVCPWFSLGNEHLKSQHESTGFSLYYVFQSFYCILALYNGQRTTDA